MSKFGDKLTEILVPIFALIGDVSVIYTIIWFIMNGIAWYWYIVLLGITFPVLFVFNKYGLVEIVKKWFKKKS